MRKLLILIGVGIGSFLLGVGGIYFWMNARMNQRLAVAQNSYDSLMTQKHKEIARRDELYRYYRDKYRRCMQGESQKESWSLVDTLPNGPALVSTTFLGKTLTSPDF